MTYFLDFDRTLFDTDSFTPTLIDNPACVELKEEIRALVSTPRDSTIQGGTGRVEVWEKLNQLCVDGKLVFAPGELSHFVFPDAVRFLGAHGNESVILSYGHEAWIKSKLGSALAGLSIERVIYAHDREKGIALQPLLKDFVPPYAFVDDLAAQLDSVRTHCPEVSLYEMRRDGKPGSGTHSVIRSFDELL